MGIGVRLFAHRLVFILNNLIIIGLVLLFLYVFRDALATGSGPVAATTFAIAVLVCGNIIGFLVWRIYICSVADRFIDALLAPREMLAKAPPVLSLAAGMLAGGDLAGADAELARLSEEYPEFPEVAMMRFELYCDRFNRPVEALEIAERYFQAPGRHPGKDNFMLLMRCADLYRDSGNPAGIIPRLQKEIRRVRFYEPVQIRLIDKRIQSIQSIGATDEQHD